MSKRKMYEQPSLPEGYFFRVSESDRWHNYVYVTIMRKGWLFNRHVIGSTCPANSSNIAYTMNDLKNAWEERQRQAKLLGDYPPKKLGDT